MKANSFVPMEMKTCVVKVNSYDRKNLTGYVYNPYFSGYVPFHSQLELFALMDNMFDDIKFPQKTMNRRSFTDTRHGTEEGITMDEPEGAVATFKLSVLFRQNASWQGTLAWVDEGSEANFRSVLELMSLMDSALTKSDESEKESDK
jgi:hypothetical protein